MMPAPEKSTRTLGRSLALGATSAQASCAMVVLIIGGLFLGIWLDGLLGTYPLLILLFMLSGIIIGSAVAVTTVLRASRAAPTENQADDKSEDGKEEDS